MVDVNDGKYTGKMSPEQTIEQFEYRAGIHLTYINLIIDQPNAGWEVYGTEEWHWWAIGGYQEGIRHLEAYIQGNTFCTTGEAVSTLLRFVLNLFKRK